MVADPGANTLVDEEGPADGVTDFAARATVVFVSGYVMTAPARAAQVWQLVALARSHGATVVLDVVPHRVEQLAPSLLGLLESVDAVMGEARTLHHLYGPGGMPASERETEALARRILQVHQLAVVRPSNGRELIAAEAGQLTWRDTGYDQLPAARRSGSHDRRNIAILADWLVATGRVT